MTQEEQVDHRWSLRRSLHVDIKLYVYDQAVICGRTRDFSIGGMFVETESFPEGIDASLVVSFTFQTEKDATHYRLPAQVIRIMQDGIGIMFTDFSSDTLQALRAMLYENHLI